jgi:asparagine synthase (glutamine-hydrolysing)
MEKSFFGEKRFQKASTHNKAFTERFHPAILASIKGNFNAVIIPKSGETPFIITGALGLKPLFYYSQDGIAFIADDLKLLKKYFPNLTFNPLALVQALTFNFPINGTSFLKGVELLLGGMIYHLSKFNNPQQWYDLEKSIEGIQYRKKDALELLRSTFNNIIKQYTSADVPVGLSLTGGFDGRTILSAIPDRKNVYLYTFGSTVSPDIQVAKHISEQLNFRHTSFFIDQEYYDKAYINKVFEFITRSNGVGAHERTHYLHAFREMSQQVKFILSGNGGSEIFRTIREGGIFVPGLAFELLQSDNPIQTIKHAIQHNPVFEIVNFDPLEYVDALFESWQQLMQELQYDHTSYRGAYRYLLKEAFRKWFGTEMRIEDKYCPNRAPFFDEEMLEAMHQTPFSVAYQP